MEMNDMPNYLSRANALIDALHARIAAIAAFSADELFALETALDNQQWDTPIIYRLLGRLDFPFYSCDECCAGHNDTCDREDDPDLCFKRWCQAVLENE